MTLKFYKWYGGKLRVVNLILLLIPVHELWYEPFMGSAAITLNHPRSEREVINDMDSDLVQLARVMADREKGKELVERLKCLWYGRWVFEEAMERHKHHPSNMSDIDRAVDTFILITQSFNGVRKSFSQKIYADTWAYRKDIDRNIPQVYERLRDVQVLNMDGINLLEKIKDIPEAFAFCDPPYRHDLRGANADKVYACELPHAEQIRLLKTIRDAKCKIMLCGYKSESGADLYDTYLLPYGWHCYKLADLVKSCQRTKKHKDIGHEYIWVNYELPLTAKYAISLTEHRTI